jgi:acyl-CoA reductase-like NAD-dependent aldehyde dehydrogenase
MDVINPASGAVFTSCARASRGQFDAAVQAAKTAFPAWASTPIKERRSVLISIAGAVESHADELAKLLTEEQGKPLAEALGEVQATAAFFRHVAGLSYDSKVLEDSGTRRATLHRVPLGVVAAITPWNFPLAIMAFKVPPALLAGNTVVLKPAATTPLTSLKFGEIIAGIVPPGVVNVVTDANDLGDVLTGHADVAKVSFTGSTATGLKVMGNAAKTLKRVGLELGGNDASIVLDDVDPAKIAEGVFRGAFFNCGQVCLSIKRLYVHESKYDELCDRLGQLATNAVVGDGMNSKTQIGPLQNKMQYEKVKGLLEDARQHGKVIAGGEVRNQGGYFISPTIVTGMEEGSRLVDEEQFGPILPIIKYKNLDDAIARSNATTYGLGASVWSSNSDRAQAVAERLVAGTVWINQHFDLAPHIPQAGTKYSGMGVEIGEEGLLEFTQVKVVNEAMSV